MTHQHLNLLNFPLSGLNLIEASAGTGKTYTLASLYVRYLLEAGLGVEQILVVTFTEAATQELRARIRQRIHALKLVFECGTSDDPILSQMYQCSTDPAKDLLTLRLAERQMDQAEIHTIHGFCKRLLQQYPLELKLPLQQTLLEDSRALLMQVLEDFWRREVLNLVPEALNLVVQHWSSPDALWADLAPLFQRRPAQTLPQPPESLEEWQSACALAAQRQRDLKQRVLACAEQVGDVLANSELKRVGDKQKWWQAIVEWCEDSRWQATYPCNSSGDNLFLRFTQDALIAETKAGKKPPEHVFFSDLASHFEVAEPPLRESFQVLAYRLVQQTFLARKTEQKVMDFDDIIAQVDQGLALAGSPELFAQIRQQFRIALIDEFQDTDPKQYRIFSSLFAPQGQPGQLVLIGDPKQAIYAFRGGDIAIYLKAKHDTRTSPSGQIFNMDTNWRSSPAMVAAVNQLFERCPEVFGSAEIPFVSVQAGRDSTADEENTAPVLTLAQLAVQLEGEKKNLSVESLRQALAQWCLSEILHLLASGRAQQQDIAILVRSVTEAELLKACFAEAGIAVCFEGKHSIFQSAEAQALYFLLLAVAEPGSVRRIRRCLADLLWGFDDSVLRALDQNPARLNHYLKLFERLHEYWQRFGVLRMIREALQQLGVLDLWRSSLFGAEMDRRLTNLNQLAELLQHQARRRSGHHELLRWLQTEIQAHLQGDLSANDETRLRLESDEKLIRIQTIHKSKGLEYRRVFIPFLFSTRKASDCWFYDDAGQRSIDLLKSDANMQRAEAERLAEDMRLLYVALTRARETCWVGTAAYQSNTAISAGLAHTAWARLLFAGAVPGKIDDAQLTQVLSDITAASGGRIASLFATADSVPTPETFTAASDSDAMPESVLAVAHMQHDLVSRSGWKVHSFSGLAQEDQHHSASLESFAHAPSEPSSAISIFSFPRGSRAGTFLHTLFERIEFASGELSADWCTRYASVPDMIEVLLRQSQLVQEELIQGWALYLAQWLDRTLRQNLFENFHLARLSSTDYVSEMNFHFSVAQLKPEAFNHLLGQYWPEFEPLRFDQFQGHMKGAMDLVFRAEGKYYVLDYKSNYLGPMVEDYGTEALQRCMHEHRYDSQYLFYCLALHRHLAQRLGAAYDYSRDFGGVVYVFLRAVGSEEIQPEMSPPGVFFTRPEQALIDALDQLLCETSGADYAA